MTAQGERYARYVGWIGEDKGSYDGNQIAAGEAITGETGLTTDAALHRICASLLTDDYDPTRPLMDYMAAAAEALGVPGGWDSVGNELPVSKPGWPPGGSSDFYVVADGLNGVSAPDNDMDQAAGVPYEVRFDLWIPVHTGGQFAVGATTATTGNNLSNTNWTFWTDAGGTMFFQVQGNGYLSFKSGHEVVPTGRWVPFIGTYDGVDFWITQDGIESTREALPNPNVYDATPPLNIFTAPANTTATADSMWMDNLIITIGGGQQYNVKFDEGSGTTAANAGTKSDLTLSAATMWGGPK